MKRLRPCLLAVIALLSLPSVTFANAGTPLMWATALHLTLGNALIGVFEGFIINRFFGAPRKRAIATMIGANYFSAWVGSLFLGWMAESVIRPDLNNVRWWFGAMAFLTYLLTLLLEWPFVLFCSWHNERRLVKSLCANLAAQTASYAVLFGWYGMASSTSLLTQARVVSLADMALPEQVVVHYISVQDGAAYQRSLRGEVPSRTSELRSSNSGDRLFLLPSRHISNHWDLMARLENGDSRGYKTVAVQTNLDAIAVADQRALHSSALPAEVDGSWFNFGQASPLGSNTNGAWEFSTAFWSHGGIGAWNKATGEYLRFAYETPFGQWPARNAIQISSNLVLFQLGGEQICVLNPETRKIALLWHGRGPVALIQRGKQR
jgi:hypothetical protein